MSKFEESKYVKVNKEILNGVPRIVDHRIAVADLINAIVNNQDKPLIKAVKSSYPQLSKEKILGVMDWLYDLTNDN